METWRYVSSDAQIWESNMREEDWEEDLDEEEEDWEQEEQGVEEDKEQQPKED